MAFSTQLCHLSDPALSGSLGPRHLGILAAPLIQWGSLSAPDLTPCPSLSLNASPSMRWPDVNAVPGDNLPLWESELETQITGWVGAVKVMVPTFSYLVLNKIKCTIRSRTLLITPSQKGQF